MPRLDELAEISGGGTPSRTQQEFFGGDIPWATPTDVTRLDTLYISRTDEAKDAYINVISTIYDSKVDRDKEEANAINANLDVQQYFAPPISRGVVDAVRALYRKQFTDEWREFGQTLKNMDVPV